MSTNLIACPDCRKEVSNSAPQCPHCGRVLKKSQSAGGVAAAIIIGLIVGALALHLAGYI